MDIFKFLKFKIFLLCINTALLYAHGIAEEQIAHLTYHIEHFYEEEAEIEDEDYLLDTKQNIKKTISEELAMLYFERGQLYQKRHLFDEAFNDYLFLLDEKRDLKIVNLALAELLFEHDFFHLSLIYVNKFLEFQENHIKALETKAKALEALGFYSESIAIYQNVISLALENKKNVTDISPSPSHFIALASVLEKRNFRYDKMLALRYLQLGIDMLGELPSLRDVYIEFAISNKQYNEALVKIDEFLKESSASITIKYLLKKAEINLLFKCYEDAVLYYQNAKINNAQFSKRHISMNRRYFEDFYLLCSTNLFEISNKTKNNKL